MADIPELVDQYGYRVQEARTIAEGIWDHDERRKIMELIGDYERLARAVKSKDLGVVVPLRNSMTR
jgi:hypothetical protein